MFATKRHRAQRHTWEARPRKKELHWFPKQCSPADTHFCEESNPCNSAWSDLPDCLLEKVFQLLIQSDADAAAGPTEPFAPPSRPSELLLSEVPTSAEADDCPPQPAMPSAAAFRLACQSWAAAGAAAVECVDAQRWLTPPEKWEQTFPNIRKLQLESSYGTTPGSTFAYRVSGKTVQHLGRLQYLKLIWPNDEEL
eukprot:scaffold297653_cov33-Prasinocladus_malaysianus.AAC.1